MKLSRELTAVGIAALLLGGSHAAAQQEAKPQHKHYEEPEGGDKPSPTGAIAPRLQNLGKRPPIIAACWGAS